MLDIYSEQYKVFIIIFFNKFLNNLHTIYDISFLCKSIEY